MKCGEEEGGKWEKGGEMGMGHKEERVKNAVWLKACRTVGRMWEECGGWCVRHGKQSVQIMYGV